MSSNINVVLTWTVCTLVASFACRCGTIHDAPAVPSSGPPDPYNPFDPAQSPVAIRQARIDAIKTDILGKLGLEEVEDGRLPGPAANVTVEERRRAMQQYRDSVDQMRGKSHRIPGEDKQLGRAKQFYSFSAIQPGEYTAGLGESSFLLLEYSVEYLIEYPSTWNSPSTQSQRVRAD